MEAAGRTFRALLKRFVDASARDLESGEQSKKKRAEDRDEQGEQTNCAVDRDLIQSRHSARPERTQDVYAPPGEEETSEPSDEGERETFSEELANDPYSACA